MRSPLPAPIRGALDAANAGDSAAFVACFRPHLGYVEDWGRQHHGDTDIRHWSEQELVAKNASIKVIHFYLVDGDGSAVVIAQLDRTDFHGPATLTFHLRDERIAVMALTA